MTYYRETYKDSPTWDGKAKGKKLIIYAEQGYGDIIQFARFFKHTGNYTILACPLPLHRLMSQVVDEVFDKEDPNLPEHDYHICSMSLPFVLNKFDYDDPYFHSEKADIGYKKQLKIGIAWEGNPENKTNQTRSCPLKYFKQLRKAKFFMLQDKVYLPEYVEECDDFELLGIEMQDFKDTASLIAAVDVVISVDTAALHLAGAMGKKAYGILSDPCDERWNVRKWYPSVTLVKGTWDNIFATLAKTKLDS